MTFSTGDSVRIIGEADSEFGGMVGTLKRIEGRIATVVFSDGSQCQVDKSNLDDIVCSPADFVSYLRSTLIPDLRQSRQNCAADDLNRCCQIIDEQARRLR